MCFSLNSLEWHIVDGAATPTDRQCGAGENFPFTQKLYDDADDVALRRLLLFRAASWVGIKNEETMTVVVQRENNAQAVAIKKIQIERGAHKRVSELM